MVLGLVEVVRGGSLKECEQAQDLAGELWILIETPGLEKVRDQGGSQ